MRSNKNPHLKFKKSNIRYWIGLVLPRMIFDTLSNRRWFRRFWGGQWNYNRYVFDVGRTVIFQWEINDAGDRNKFYKTIVKENYKEK